MNAKEEYDNFLEYYYLDYNILSSIISFFENPNSDSYKTSYFLYTMLISFYDLKKICIPYSDAHMCDIYKGTKLLENKISIIKNLSNGWFIKEDIEQDNLVRVDKCENIQQHFDGFYESMKFTENIQKIFDPLIEKSVEYSFLNNYDTNLLPFDINKKIENLYTEKKIKNGYDVFQFFYKIINILNIKNNINFNILTKGKLQEKIEYYLQDNLYLKSIGIKTIQDFNNFHSKYHGSIKQSDFSKSVFMYSLLCDYIGITKESKRKIYDENFASGMINDLLHLSIGIRCPIFVTNDSNLRIKAIVCKKMCDLNVRIFSLENFFQYIVNDYMKIKCPEGNEFIISCEINDKKISKTIKTDYDKILFD